jgi:hypothetical protein
MAGRSPEHYVDRLGHRLGSRIGAFLLATAFELNETIAIGTAHEAKSCAGQTLPAKTDQRRGGQGDIGFTDQIGPERIVRRGRGENAGRVDQ